VDESNTGILDVPRKNPDNIAQQAMFADDAKVVSASLPAFKTRGVDAYVSTFISDRIVRLMRSSSGGDGSVTS